MAQFLPLFFFLVFLILGSVVVGAAIQMLQRAIASKKWPTTEGRVLGYKVLQEPAQERGSRPSGTVLYEYSVNDKVYSSDRMHFGGREIPPGRIPWKYVSREYVVVHYDPGNPRISVLEPGLRFGNFFCLGVGLLFVGIGLFGVLGVLW